MEALQQQLTAPLMPPPISWWPPAPGWWALLVMLLLSLLLLPWLLRRSRRNRRRGHGRRNILADIPSGLSDSQWLAQVNIRLKQVLKQRGEEHATRLFGEAWLDYLCSRSPGSQRQALQPLAADLYHPQTSLSDEQREALLRELHRWIRHEHV